MLVHGRSILASCLRNDAHNLEADERNEASGDASRVKMSDRRQFIYGEDGVVIL
jgi:hypothetical protein